MDNIKLLFFGSDGCEKCCEVKDALLKNNIEYDFVDAFDKSSVVQAFCDDHFVDEIPHLKIYKNKECLREFIGDFDVEVFLSYYKSVIGK
jgi:glutaredoxin-related protein